MEEPDPGELVKLLKLLLRQGCTHRFSWPRIDGNGRHYQICLACGTAYEYDWEMMRRTDRPLAVPVHDELHGPRLSH
jgi:hypothetical protein